MSLLHSVLSVWLVTTFCYSHTITEPESFHQDFTLDPDIGTSLMKKLVLDCSVRWEDQFRKAEFSSLVISEVINSSIKSNKVLAAISTIQPQHVYKDGSLFGQASASGHLDKHIGGSLVIDFNEPTVSGNRMFRCSTHAKIPGETNSEFIVDKLLKYRDPGLLEVILHFKEEDKKINFKLDELESTIQKNANNILHEIQSLKDRDGKHSNQIEGLEFKSKKSEDDIKIITKAVDENSKSNELNSEAIDEVLKSNELNAKAIDENSESSKLNSKAIDKVSKSSKLNTESVDDNSKLLNKLVNLRTRYNYKVGEATISKEILGKRYLLVRRKLVFASALQECQKNGGYLAEINTPEEYDQLRAFVKEASGYHTYIGHADLIQEGYWKAVTHPDDTIYNRWWTGQPDNVKGNEHCGHFHTSFQWHLNDIHCTHTMHFVCEF